ncbi:MAG: hypothetical protein ACYCVB_11795 [Bacilli bacterium]
MHRKSVSQTIMTAVNPNGTRYADPGVPWVMYSYRGGFARIPIGAIGTVESGPAM